MNEKRYLAFYDNGHDFGEFTFFSTHRANSRANLDDARHEAAKKWGWRYARAIRITSTVRDYNEV